MAQPGIISIGITPKIAVEAQTLPGEFHKDPADRIIVATTRVLNASLITVDRKILNYRFVKTIPLHTN